MSDYRRPLLVATTNRKKLDELNALLAAVPVKLLCLKDLESFEEVPESGGSFTENAVLKAYGYARQSGLLTLAEDSGLCCEALEGAPGVYSARFSGDAKDDDENNRKLLSMMEPIPDADRRARFVSAVAVAEPGRLVGVVEGFVEGFIARSRSGSHGFGYDPVFYYPPYKKTFGEVSAEMKHKVSHRFLALSKARELLREHLNSGGFGPENPGQSS